MTCPHCREDARFVNYRPKQVTTLLGDIRLPRAYYHCPHCSRGLFPWDQTLRVLKAPNAWRRRSDRAVGNVG